MKRKLFFLSVFLFISNLCYPFLFRELTLEETEVFRQKWVKKENLETSPDQSLIAETDKKTCEVKALFESMPVDFEASPFIYYTSEKYIYALNLRKDSLNILFLSFTIDEEGLHGPAEVFVNTDCLSDLEESSPCISLYFKDFCLKSDGSVISGESLDDWSDIYLNEDYDFSFYKSTLEKKGDSYVVLGNLVLRYPFAYVNLGRLAFDAQCNLLTSEEYKQGLAPVSGGDGYAFQISSVRFDGEKLYGSGTIKVPGLNLIGNYNAYEICFSPEEITAPLKGSGSSFKYRGYSLQGKRILIYQDCKNDDIKIFASSLLFQGRKMPLGDIFFHHDYYSENAHWRFVGGRSYDSEVQTKILCDDDIVDNCYFDAQGLRIRVLTKFPKANKKGQYYYFIAKADGSLLPYDNQTYYENRNFGFEDSELLSKDVTLLMEEEKFYISRATLAFPQNSCLSEMYFNDLYLNFDGRVEQYEIPFCSLQICGMGFILDKASFVDDGIIFSGTLYLPEALPGIFSGSRMTVEKFYIGFDGMVKELVAHREESTSFYVSNYIIASTKGSHLEIEQMKNPDGSLEPAKLYLCMDNSGIVLPSGYYIDESNIPMENFRCNLVDYKGFNLADATYSSNFELGISGMTLDVTDMKFVPQSSSRRGNEQNGYFQFTGMITLPNGDHV
nr:hypothetical protein [Treponemataceae bacterium]